MVPQMSSTLCFVLALLDISAWPSAGLLVAETHGGAGADGAHPVSLAVDGIRDEVYHLHIPKVAGISFAHQSMKILGPSGFHIISREGCHSDQDDNPRLLAKVGLVRRP